MTAHKAVAAAAKTTAQIFLPSTGGFSLEIIPFLLSLRPQRGGIPVLLPVPIRCCGLQSKYCESWSFPSLEFVICKDFRQKMKTTYCSSLSQITRNRLIHQKNTSFHKDKMTLNNLLKIQKQPHISHNLQYMRLLYFFLLDFLRRGTLILSISCNCCVASDERVSCPISTLITGRCLLG